MLTLCGRSGRRVGGRCNLHISFCLNSTPKIKNQKNLRTRLYSYINQRKNVALALTILKCGGGTNVAVSLLLIPPNCRDTSASSKKRTNAEPLSLFNFNRKTPFLKHKNVNLKNLPEVKVVRTDFRRSKSINTTHLRQDIITTSFRILSLFIAGSRVGLLNRRLTLPASGCAPQTCRALPKTGGDC